MVDLKMVSFSFVFPDEPLKLIKSLLDVLLVFSFVLLLIVAIYAKNNFPLFKKKIIFHPLLSAAVLGLLSSIMDAIDEFVWFNPKQFYDEIWKPVKMTLIAVSVFLMAFMFIQVLKYSKRLLGE